MEEIFDIIDEDGLPTGKTVERSKAHAEGILHRTSHIWVLRYHEDGTADVLLQKRSLQKDSFPGGLDTSSAGHIQAGDEPLESALRELGEELDIHAEENDLKFIGTFRIRYELPFHGKMFRDNEISFVYAYEKPVDITSLHLQKEELDSVQWENFDDVLRKCQKKDPAYCVPLPGLMTLKSYLDGRK